MRPLFLITGLILLFALEILRVYFIMPFPGSQHGDTIDIAYFLDKNIFWLRILALVMVLPPLAYFLGRGRTWQKILLSVAVLLYAGIFYLFNFRFLADKMFLQPHELRFAGPATDTTNKDRLVIGISFRGEAKAYPIEIIGYHHQVRDTLSGLPVMVTYCTVCRTGRVFLPEVGDRVETFRLVGMDHFNAMFEDAGTKSWWQQATGIAITGPLKGKQLPEFPSAQMRLGDWQVLHQASLTMQPDPTFRAKYDSLKGYDEGTIGGSLEKRDSGSWKFKSWVVGLTWEGKTKAYDWNRLVKDRIILDTIGKTQLLLTITPDNRSFHALQKPDSLQFHYDTTRHLLQEVKTGSHYRLDGECIDCPVMGTRLTPVQAYQEFWHSWKNFHPGTMGGEAL